AILAAMLLPALSQAREKARAASCINNLKQIGLMVFVYAQDNDGFVPVLNQPCSCHTLISYWWQGSESAYHPYFANPYLGSGWMGRGCLTDCPSRPYTGSYSGDKQFNLTDYGLSTSLAGTKLDRVISPSEKVAFMDANYWRVDATQPQGAWWQEQANWVHSGGANVLFCDGHVEWIKQGGKLTDNWFDVTIVN
ncbi:MAG: DUF1559 domain-containing protein, partial [Candidatus Omnitrophota bacterium]